MKILQLCNKPPLPAIDGGCLAMHALTQGFLEQGHEVTIISIVTDKHPFREDQIDKSYLRKTRFTPVYVDTRLNIVDAFSNLVTQDSYNISRFFSPDFDIKLRELLQKEKFDIIQFESLFMTPYLATARRYNKAKMVLRSHNLEYLIWKRLADGSKNIARKFYLNHLAKKLEQFELKMIPQMDGVVTISADDYKRYTDLTDDKNKLLNIPFGINLSEYELSEGQGEISLFHLGSLSWVPNLEGVTWFLEEVWKKIQPDFPLLKFYLAGRNIPHDFRQAEYQNVKIVGEVEDAKKFISSKAIMLVPILSAGGMRVKIIEGMALGKTILSTTLGAEGIDFQKDKDILIADTAEEFKRQLNTILNSPDFLKNQFKRSRKFVDENYDNYQLVSKLLEFYDTLCYPDE